MHSSEPWNLFPVHVIKLQKQKYLHNSVPEARAGQNWSNIFVCILFGKYIKKGLECQVKEKLRILARNMENNQCYILDIRSFWTFFHWQINHLDSDAKFKLLLKTRQTFHLLNLCKIYFLVHCQVYVSRSLLS